MDRKIFEDVGRIGGGAKHDQNILSEEYFSIKKKKYFDNF